MVALSDGHLKGVPRFLFIKPCSPDVAASLHSSMRSPSLAFREAPWRKRWTQSNRTVGSIYSHLTGATRDNISVSLNTASPYEGSERTYLQCTIYESYVS